MNLSKFIGSGGQAGYLGTNAMQRALDSGLSISDIKKFASQQGLQLGSEAGLRYPKLNANLTKAATQGPSIKNAKNVGQALRIAGGNGGISKKELNQIADATGKSFGQVISRLDKANSNLKGKGKGSINLKSGAANMVIRGASKSRSDPLGAARRDFEFGDGKIGTQLGDMSGLNTPINIPNRMLAGGGWTPPKGAGGGGTPGGKEFEPEYLTRGIDLTGRGSGTTVRGVGKEYVVPDRLLPKPSDTPNDIPNDTPRDVSPNTPVDIPEPELEEIDTSASSGAGGADLASWATSYRKARSARQKSGRRAQGLASKKKNPFKSWNS